jgi:glycosyltransferase involved in cell wall biosynthesis
MDDVTIIVPYYRNPLMLEQHVRSWDLFPYNFKFIVVDDGSPEPVESIPNSRIKVLRIEEDIPWNRAGARNLGAHVADTDWIIHMDIDHFMPLNTAVALAQFTALSDHWYRFARYRFGAADATRKKDDLPDDVMFGKVKPHMDSYMVERSMYWALGGYDEDYSGSLGGGVPFVKELEKAGIRQDLDDPYYLYVYTTDAISDASDSSLSRDKARYSEIRKSKADGKVPKKEPLQFKWKTVD